MRATVIYAVIATMVCVAGAAWAQGDNGPASKSATKQPVKSKGKARNVPEELRPIEDVKGLPRVLLIGDSISMGYTLDVRRLLEGKANVHRIPANGGPTTTGLAELDEWLGKGKQSDIDVKTPRQVGEMIKDPPPDLHASPPKEAWKVDLLKQPIRAYCIDFNWLLKKDGNVFASPGHWADADPAAHVKWYKDIGANCIQTFVLSCNGHAWYKGGPIPEQPGLKSDFLPEVVRLGHEQRMLVMGYYCIAANSLWGQRHPDQSYGTPSGMHIPLTKDYIDYLCASVEDALKKTGIDGFMLDWLQNTSGKWLDCEKTMYAELMGVPFPGADKITPAEKNKFDGLAVERCWTRIRDTARKVKPDCILWPNGLHHLKLEGVDWLLNEGPDVQTTENARQRLDGRPTRLIQNQVGWSRHDARKVFSNARYRSWDFYGFAAPCDNSLPLPVAKYLKRPIDDFKGTNDMTINDRNIAALIRFYLGKPVEPPPAAPANLRCEYLENPLGTDVAKPRLSWKLEEWQGAGDTGQVKRGVKQTAYQVLVASSEELLKRDKGDLWDSGKVESDQSINVEYAGKALASRMQCFWKVRAWTGANPEPRTLNPSSPSDWSKPAFWTMGLLEPASWSAKWIGLDRDDGSPEARNPEQRRLPARYLRHDFKVDKKINRATAYIGSSLFCVGSSRPEAQPGGAFVACGLPAGREKARKLPGPFPLYSHRPGARVARLRSSILRAGKEIVPTVRSAGNLQFRGKSQRPQLPLEASKAVNATSDCRSAL